MRDTIFNKLVRKIVAALLALVTCTAMLIAIPCMAETRLPMPGSTWGNIRFPSSAQPAESDNLLLNGAIEQGVDFMKISPNTVLNFFGRVDYRWDTEGLDFNRKLLFGTGFKLRHYFSDTFVMSVGAKYEIDKRFVIERSSDGLLLFGQWFGSWHLANSDHGSAEQPRPLAYPGLTWGEIRYPGSQDPIEESSMVFEGYTEQGVDWAHWGRWGTFNFYGNLDYIVDTEEIEWNNLFAVGVGVKLKKLVGRNILLQYGVEATRERYWVSDETLDVIFVYLNWSAWWDPRAVRRDLPE